MSTKVKTLIVDDECELRKSIVTILSNTMPNYDFVIKEAANGKEAIEAVAIEEFDLVLMDVRMPELDGLTALHEIKSQNPRTFVVIMTAHGNLQDAVSAIKDGAYDYIEKPLQQDKLIEIVKKAIETQEMVSRLAISQPIFDDDLETEFVASSEKMHEVFDLIHRLSHVDTTVLIRGESGTGKELIAKAIHSNSPRKHGDFVAINCGAIPDTLMESELFGHEKGAFTGAIERKIGKFQIANKGTILLDEISEMKPDLQVKLLRVLQEKKFVPVGGTREVKTNTRIIATTSQNLELLMEEDKFREDLFYRLNVMPIFLPPLRDRGEDIPHLITYFIRKYSKQLNSPIVGMSDDARKRLKDYRWPGNIRELENVIERAFIVENSSTIQLSSLPDNIVNFNPDAVNIDVAKNYLGPLDFDRFKEETEKEFLVKALKTNKGKINKTVARANIPKNTLLRKIKKYEIDVKQFFD